MENKTGDLGFLCIEIQQTISNAPTKTSWSSVKTLKLS